MSSGVVHTGDGMGWCCLICCALGCSPADLSDMPAMVVIDGVSLCRVHLPVYEDAPGNGVTMARRARLGAAADLARERELPRRDR